MKKYRVLFVYHALFVGGAEKELLAYITFLNKSKYSVHLALTSIQGELFDDIPDYVSIHKVEGDSFTPDGKYLFNLYRIINTLNPSVVIGFMQDINFNILLIKYLTHKNYKIIASEQVVLSEWQKIKKTPWLKRMLIKALYHKADIIAGQAQPILRDLKHNFGINKHKLTLVPSFISKNAFKHRLSLSYKKSNISPFFLYVGRLAPEKNIELLLQAFALILPLYKKVNLIIAGPYVNCYYQNLCRSLDILQSVRFVGYTSETQRFYRHALALIIPSFVEGRSRVMIEAMLSDCPVICSDFIGHQDYITDKINGLIFQKNSVKNLAQKMLYALQYPHRMKQITKQAKKTLKENFPNGYVSNYRNTLNKLFDRALIE